MSSGCNGISAPLATREMSMEDLETNIRTRKVKIEYIGTLIQDSNQLFEGTALK